MGDYENGLKHNGACVFAEACREHFADEKEMARKVAATLDTIESMKAELRHLAALPKIESHLETLSEALVGAAIGRKQVPLSVFSIVVLMLSIGVLFLVVRDSDRNVRLTGSGLFIERNDTNSTKPGS